MDVGEQRCDVGDERTSGMERRASAGEAVISTTTSKRPPRRLVAGSTKPPATVATARTNALRMTEAPGALERLASFSG